MRRFWFSLQLWGLTSSPLHTSVVLAHVYLVGIKMYLNFRNENGNLNRKHGRLTCSSLSLLHLLDICFKNQNTEVLKALEVGARGETHPCPTQVAYSWGWFICRRNYRANHSWCWNYLVTVQRFPDWSPSFSSDMVWAYCTGKTAWTRLCHLANTQNAGWLHLSVLEVEHCMLVEVWYLAV